MNYTDLLKHSSKLECELGYKEVELMNERAECERYKEIIKDILHAMKHGYTYDEVEEYLRESGLESLLGC